MRIFLHKAGVVGLLCMGSLACAPLQTSLYMREAEQAMEQARAQEALERSPYAWTMAELYLEKAKEKNGRSQYEQAMEYSKKAKQWALSARNDAMSVSEDSP
jgi:lipopolysaccharide biosynthesis regulator YciM